MLKKLRIKFVAMTMVVVTVILTAAFAVICHADWQQSVREADAALEAAIMRAAHAPERAQTATPNGSLSEADAVDGGAPPAEAGGNAPPAETGMDPAEPPKPKGDVEYVVDRDGNVSGEALSGGIRGIYPATKSGRFDAEPVPNMFTAVHKLNGDTWEMLFDESTALAVGPLFSNEMVREGTGMTSENGTGTWESRDLYCMKKTLPEGTFLAMVYAGPLNEWKTLALRLAGIGAVTLVVFFLFSLAFSKWALAPVERTWAQQRRFVADASHDLKTPLTVIAANTSILLDEPDRSATEERRWLESTKDEAQEMQGLLDDLLALADADESAAAAKRTRATNGGAAAENAVVNFSKAVTREVLQFESVAFERGLSMESDVQKGIQVAGSEERIRRVVQVLLDNACKYAGAGGRVAVKLSASLDGKRAVLKVRNSGEPMTPEALAHAFDRFYRADEARTSKEGHGLGLSIAKAFVEECGGRVTVESDAENGTTFTVEIPTA